MDDSLEVSHDGANDTTTTIPEQPANPPTESVKQEKKKKRKRPQKNPIKSHFTIRNPPWQYLHLQHLTSNPASSTTLDPLTAHLHLTAALTQFLGLHGAAIPIDILNLNGDDVWIRVLQGDRNVVSAALAGWVSGRGEAWRVKGAGSWCVSTASWGRDGGQDLFGD